jgi:hypothetical protein
MNLLPVLTASVFAAGVTVKTPHAARPIPGLGQPLKAGAATPLLRVPARLSMPVPAVPAFKALPAPAPEGKAKAVASARAQVRLAAVNPEVFDGNSEFLKKLGFRDYSATIAESLSARGLTESQREVLTFNRERYQVFNAARDLASAVMGAVAEQGYSKKSLSRASELAARLLALQPLEPPATLPAEIARQKKDKITDWLSRVTAQKLRAQSEMVASDVVGVIAPDGKVDEKTALQVKAWVDKVLLTAYTDAEIGQTRYAGRALAASLVRYSRAEGKPSVEKELSEKVRERGLYLENFVGDTLVLKNRGHEAKRVKIENGDFLGERSGGREASEITFAVRPPLSLWFKARKEHLLGSMTGLWANPKAFPKIVRGQPVRNSLKMGVWRFKKWLASKPALQLGYSHVGMAQVERADGVAMTWALDNYPNAGEGGIRKIGVAEQFAENGPYLRLGVSRLDPHKTWDAFQKQARAGYQETVYSSEGGEWPNLATREDFEAARETPRTAAPFLLYKMNQAATAVLEEMMTRFGVGFAYGFNNEIWKAYCSATMMLAHKMGSGFEVQDKQDHWHPVVTLMKKLGIGGAKDQNMEGRIVWPGSFFLDPKIASHTKVSFEKFTEVGRLADPYTMSAYVETDPALTRRLREVWAAQPGAELEEDALFESVRAHLDTRASKSRNKNGYASGASESLGYSAGLESLMSEADDD